MTDPVSVRRMRVAFQELWDDERGVPLTREFLASYAEARREPVVKAIAETVEPQFSRFPPTKSSKKLWHCSPRLG